MNIDLIKQRTGIVGESEEINEVLETVSQRSEEHTSELQSQD